MIQEDFEREYIQKLTYNINNGGNLQLIQRGHDGKVLILDSTRFDDCDRPIEELIINPGEMVMLINYFRHVKEHDIQNDFINPNGKNKEWKI